MRFLLLCAALAAAAESKPDFSGNWLLNPDASDYTDPRAVRPEKMTLSIQQKNDRFKYRVENQARGRKYTYDVDASAGGAPFESDAAGVVSIEWSGATLVVSTLFNPGQERQSDQVDRWTLSPDGKRLTSDLVVHPPQNRPAVHIVRVFEKK